MDKNEPISFDKPGYDGRLNYHALLKQYMVAIAEASINNNIKMWVLLLRDLYGFVAPFIKSDDAKSSLIEIEQIQDTADVMDSCSSTQNQQAIFSIVRKKLRNATDNLYARSKHLLLPVKSDAEESFNEADFMAGSDL